MYKVRVRILGEGQHPSEQIISVRTQEGLNKELIVDKRSIEMDDKGNPWLPIGYPIRKKVCYLIELPRETIAGEWRVWVSEDNLMVKE